LPGVGQNLRDHPLVHVNLSVDENLQPDRTKGTRFETMLIHTGRFRNDLRIFPVFLPPGVPDPTTGTPPSVAGVAIAIALELPLSTGEVQLCSAEPLTKPIVHFRYLEDEHDIIRFSSAVRMVVELLSRPQLARMVSGRLSPTKADLESDNSFRRWAHTALSSAKHSCGTCKMAASDDPMGVVDETGRVRGVENVTVADLSIAPNVVRAPTNATAFVIGERIAHQLTQSP
jgi:choline dehydrogenase-like flavoprotein